MSLTWGASATGPAEDLGDLIDQAVTDHLDETERSVSTLRARLDGWDADPADLTYQNAVADCARLEATLPVCREQAASAIASARALISAGHITNATISVGGNANPDHDPNGVEFNFAAQIVIALVRG